jgi:glycosyltransferase involved in cell wall biosynthesis
MKFLLVTYNDSDGVGQTVVNLNTTLNNLGHQSKIILLSQSVNSKNIFKIKRSFLKRFFYYFLEFLKTRNSDLFSFGNSTVDYRLIENYVNDSEIIIFYTLHKFLSLDMLPKLLSKKKIFYFRPLDMELATGGCHVNFLYENGEECKKYLNGCNKCPKLNNLNFFNLSNKIFKKKRDIINKFKPTILLENKFTKNFYDRSLITKNAKNEVIYLPVREKRKNFIEKAEARKIFQLDNNEKILLFGTYNLDAPHKGGRILGEILNLFVDYCNEKDENPLNKNKVKLVTFGRKQSLNIKVPNIKWHHINVIKGDKKLNAIYRAADVFLSPSTGCNAPSTVREATVNNLPIIAFDNGEASEAIINNDNGFLISKYDKKNFAIAIYKILFNKKFQNDKKWNTFLKLRYSSKTEAEMIINKAFSDLRNFK